MQLRKLLPLLPSPLERTSGDSLPLAHHGLQAPATGGVLCPRFPDQAAVAPCTPTPAAAVVMMLYHILN